MEVSVGDYVAAKASENKELRTNLHYEIAVTFEELANVLNASIAEAEQATAKAIQDGLVIGRIDQLKAELHCTAGQPRVFKEHHYDEIIERLNLWKRNVAKLANRASD